MPAKQLRPLTHVALRHRRGRKRHWPHAQLCGVLLLTMVGTVLIAVAPRLPTARGPLISIAGSAVNLANVDS